VDTNFHQGKFQWFKGWSRDLAYSEESLFKECGGGVPWRVVVQDICVWLIEQGYAEDIIPYGSFVYGGMRQESDVDLIGIDRTSRKDVKYLFYVQNGNEKLPFCLRIETGRNAYHTRLDWQPFPSQVSGFSGLRSPKYWSIFTEGIFRGSSLMYRMGQLDAIIMLRAIIGRHLHLRRATQISVEDAVEHLRYLLRESPHKRVFRKDRWERGAQAHARVVLGETMKFCSFWLSPSSEEVFEIRKDCDIIPAIRPNRALVTLAEYFHPFHLAYLRDKRVARLRLQDFP